MNRPTSRRTILTGASALAFSATLPLHAAAKPAPKPASAIGGWMTDDRDLPAYAVTADLPLRTTDAAGHPYPLDPDPFFLIGNYRLSLFTHASGLYKLMSGERGWTRLNEPLSSAEQNSATLDVIRKGNTEHHNLLGLDGVCADGRRSQRRFGCGSVQYDLAPDRYIRVVRTLSLAPSTDHDTGQPAFVVHVRLTNTARTACDIAYRESVLSHPALTVEYRTPDDAKTVRFAQRVEADAARGFIAAHAIAQAGDPGILRERDHANRYNLFPPSLILAAPQKAAQNSRTTFDFTHRPLSPGAAHLDATARTRLAPGESRTLVFVIALAPLQDPADSLAFANALTDSPDGLFFARDWQSALNTFNTVEDPVFRRELTWNSHALLAMATWSEFYGETFIPQGMTYDYQMDVTAAPRDHLQHAMAAAYFRPALAKSSLRFVLSKMTIQGEIKYTDLGFGKTSNSAWNTSDQQLYLFQAAGEYLRITGDYAFLDEETTFLPHEAGYKATVLDKLERAMTYLRDEVATGPHGLVRLMNSDWSDMVFADTSVLRYFWTAESHMNSAMVMAVMPNLAAQVARYAKTVTGTKATAANRLTASLNLYVDRISKAYYADMGDRAFSRRLYFDPSRSFGDDDMHIEPQSFLLQAASFPVERKRRLWAEVQKRLMQGEVLGPRQREAPITGGLIAPNVSENGGFWFSLAGQMITGVATFDKPAALSLLRMMTFDNAAKHYPSYWTGLWSAADTVNAAASGAIAGLPRPDNGGLWATFASYCAHPHAWPIYAWSKINEA